MTTPVAATWLLGAHSSAKTAHLMLEPNARHHGSPVAWCNQSLDASRPAPYVTRCKRCLTLLENYASSAALDPPERVRTTVTLVIEHNAAETAEEVLKTVIRRAVPPSARTWTLGDGSASSMKVEVR